MLCDNNLSRFAQPVELALRRWEGVIPVELLGGARFPQIGELPYLLTLLVLLVAAYLSACLYLADYRVRWQIAEEERASVDRGEIERIVRSGQR